MKIFISWSGACSKGVAECLRIWLPNVLQVANPFLSTTDIGAGQDFESVLRKELAECDFGVICLTKENCRRPWMLFEAGAIAKAFNISNVCPYLIDMEPGALPSPLSSFQAVSADEEGTSRLVGAINSASELVKLSEPQLQKTFERWWPDLSSEFNELKKTVCSTRPGPASSIEEFFVFNVKHNQCLQATGAKRKNGAAIILAPFNFSERQKWSFYEQDGNCFAIK